MKKFPWWLFRYLKGYRLPFVIAIITMVLNSGITSYLAYFVKDIVNTVFVTKNEHMIKVIPIVLIGLVSLKGVAFFVNYYTMAYIGQKVIATLRQDLYKKVLKLPYESFLEEPPGSFVSRIINDTALLQDFTSRQLATVSRNILTAVGLICIVIYQDALLATIGFIGLPAIGYLISRVGKRVKKYTYRMQEKLATLTNHLFEGVKNIKEIKLFLSANRFYKLFKRDNDLYVKQFMKIKEVEGIYPPMVEITASIIVSILILYGGKQIVAGRLSPGAFFSFIIALIMAYEPIRKIGQDYSNIQQSISVSGRIKAILDAPDEYMLKDGKKILKGPIVELQFEHVYFRYPKSRNDNLSNVNLKFEKGKRYSIVGKTGSGKTTIVNLIPRFYDPQEGSITANGINIRDLKLKDYRRRIGMVSQEVVLFRGTIKENISIGNPSATETEIIKAAMDAGINDFVSSLPDGYDTLIGEGGIQVSGGQKQRMAIARAIIKNPDVLILDEATSGLDVETERFVHKAIEKNFSDRIVISVAHRLSTVLNSDEIILVKKGKIMGKGNHEELLRKSNDYRKLCEIQFKSHGKKRFL